MEQIKQTVIKFKDSCNICGKEIIGNSEGQVLYNMEIHKRQKHKNGTKKF